MTPRLVYVACMLVACGKSQPADPPSAINPSAAAKPARPADAACVAKVKDLEPWLAKLDVEKKSYEVDMGPKLQLIDREPVPVPTHVDAVEIRAKSIAAWDIGEHDHASTRLAEHATPKQLSEFLTQMHDQKASADAFEPASDDLLRIDVDRDAPWGDVARVLDAATRAGYKRATFAFTATSKLVAPPGVDDKTQTAAAAKAASDQLEALGTRCKQLGDVPLHHTRNPEPASDASALAKETASAVLACNCAADPDELRRLAWVDARWHQAVPRVGVELALDPAATTTIALPAKTPWSEAHAKLLSATGPVKLAAK